MWCRPTATGEEAVAARMAAAGLAVLNREGTVLALSAGFTVGDDGGRRGRVRGSGR